MWRAASWADSLGNVYSTISNTDTNTVLGADLAVTKLVDDPNPVQGATVTFTVGVTNLGTTSAGGVSVADALPAGLVFVSATATAGSYDSGSGLWSVGSLLNGASETLTITADVTGHGDSDEYRVDRRLGSS